MNDVTHVISASLLHESLLAMSLDLFRSSSWFFDDKLTARPKIKTSIHKHQSTGKWNVHSEEEEEVRSR